MVRYGNLFTSDKCFGITAVQGDELRLAYPVGEEDVLSLRQPVVSYRDEAGICALPATGVCVLPAAA